MKIALTNLSNHSFNEGRERLNTSALKHGVQDLYSFSFESFSGKPFFKQFEHILAQPRGLGYWLWKPYIILETLEQLNDGDVLIYSDCGIEIIEDLSPLVEICAAKQPVVLFANGNLLNAAWTKRDCFVRMNADAPAYWLAIQCDASFALFRKGSDSVKFVQEWLNYASNESILTDIPNSSGKRNLPGFIEHRHDQSILSILAKKYGYSLYRQASQYGNHYKMPELRVPGEFNCVSQRYQQEVSFYAQNWFSNSPYPQLLHHHRLVNAKNNTVQKRSLATVLSSYINRLSGKIFNLYYKKYKNNG
ncbi:hypothetical protein [Parasegetibacter sp. NRK P23]|uniref:hypothetical protein n=1 Tax=Parasegetibacter sp. NRK P23 TaxID=2942999 RepID=UPI00204482BB|nr:hypothetical protein [Parasegetibacter sp. NRK P23]MCM5528543.1 hypothetical protein [Parasegetibacter sp. NRK P23]